MATVITEIVMLWHSAKGNQPVVGRYSERDYTSSTTLWEILLKRFNFKTTKISLIYKLFPFLWERKNTFGDVVCRTTKTSRILWRLIIICYLVFILLKGNVTGDVPVMFAKASCKYQFPNVGRTFFRRSVKRRSTNVSSGWQSNWRNGRPEEKRGYLR